MIFGINARLERIQAQSHFGDAKSLGDGLAELRWKNGWRIYFFKEGRDMVVLLVGGLEPPSPKGEGFLLQRSP